MQILFILLGVFCTFSLRASDNRLRVLRQHVPSRSELPKGSERVTRSLVSASTTDIDDATLDPTFLADTPLSTAQDTESASPPRPSSRDVERGTGGDPQEIAPLGMIERVRLALRRCLPYGNANYRQVNSRPSRLRRCCAFLNRHHLFSRTSLTVLFSSNIAMLAILYFAANQASQAADRAGDLAIDAGEKCDAAAGDLYRLTQLFIDFVKHFDDTVASGALLLTTIRDMAANLGVSVAEVLTLLRQLAEQGAQHGQALENIQLQLNAMQQQLNGIENRLGPADAAQVMQLRAENDILRRAAGFN